MVSGHQNAGWHCCSPHHFGCRCCFRRVSVILVGITSLLFPREKNPIRDIRARYKAKLEKWEKFFEEDPLGQKISDHYAELKELIKEVRQRIRKQLAKYIKQLKSE
ncbi:hypothetical protein ECG_08182 [Echinococcus granulosus]|nr:hypothetical protein ECG_08182 [Echinococcus granulosus]